MLDYIDCPARYRYLHIIGMPERDAEPSDEPGDAGAGEFGHLVHDMLASVDFGRDVMRQVEALVARLSDESVRAQARSVLDPFTDTRWRREMASAKELIREAPFEITFGGRVLAGRMDVLYRGTDGWTILDYKTGRAESRERYELQVGLYAYAASRLLGEMPARAALLLLSLGDEWVQDTSDGLIARSSCEKMAEVADAIDAGRFEPRPGKPCEWCDFGLWCRQE
jgi:ATP-dependent exoDNAse (exonuclease V) beta subunit